MYVDEDLAYMVDSASGADRVVVVASEIEYETRVIPVVGVKVVSS